MKFYDATNRVDDAIARQQGRIDALVEKGVDLQGKPIAPSLANVDATVAVSASDHAAYQRQQSRAVTLGTLNTDEALTIYNALGGAHNPDNGGWSDGVGLAKKIIVTQIISELLARRI